MAEYLISLSFPLEYNFDLKIEAGDFKEALEKAKAEAFARALPVPEAGRKELLLTGDPLDPEVRAWSVRPE